MNKIYYILGKSSTGKDTLYKKLLKDEELKLKSVVRYTTRPIREGETDGVEYYFVTEEVMREFEQDGKLIESHGFSTIYGIWYYFTANDGQIKQGEQDYLMIGVLESYYKTRQYFGEKRVIPLYIELEDGLRLERAIKREKKQPSPRYKEMCRRFLADEEDFREEWIRACGIERRFQNIDLDVCFEELKNEILKG